MAPPSQSPRKPRLLYLRPADMTNITSVGKNVVCLRGDEADARFAVHSCFLIHAILFMPVGLVGHRWYARYNIVGVCTTQLRCSGGAAGEARGLSRPNLAFSPLGSTKRQ